MAWLSRGWWAVVARGAIALIFGAIAVLHPMTSVELGTLFGVAAFALGVLAILAGLGAPFTRVTRANVTRTNARLERSDVGWPLVVEGILGVGLGALAVATALAPIALAVIIAAFALVTGFLELATALQLHRVLVGERLLAVAGIASLGAALVLGARASFGATSEQVILGVYALVFGALLVPAGVRLRRWEDGDAADA